MPSRVSLQVMKTLAGRNWLVLIMCCAMLPGAELLADVLVHDQAEAEAAISRARPGDVIVLANGVWKDFEILFEAQGSPDAPVTLTAEEKGKVVLSGQSSLRLAGEYLVVSGLVFRDGYTPRNEVISFRRNKEHLASHSRVTETVIDHFNNPERTESDFWVMMYGKNNRFDHNHLVGKSNAGVTMAVRLDSAESQQNHHRIDHNYFGPRPNLGSNGGETLRIGTSAYSLTDSFTVVEDNYFDRCNGEVEIISVKSGNNVVRGNVFFESRGTLTLRHGNDNLVENNVFFGNGVDHTGGIRVINKRQTIRNNYMEGLTGYRFAGALVVMNGVPDSPINRYHQVDGALIENNSVMESDHIQLAAGSDEERSAVPVNSVFRNNLVFNADGRDTFTVYDDISGISFENNAVNHADPFSFSKGFINKKIAVERATNGLLYPRGKAFAEMGAGRELKVLAKEATGVAWYPKPGKDGVFDTGHTIRISPDDHDFAEQVAASKAGDVVELEAGEYRVEKLLEINHPLTIRGAGKESAASSTLVQFERSALFQINNGGSLKLESLSVNGELAPDAAGNAVIRTSRYSMLQNYELLILNCSFSDLDVNHSFNLLTAAKGTLAANLEIHHSDFKNITGAILELDKETDDLGLYNAEYISIENSHFSNVGKALMTVYRGGTDESTFGPHVSIQDSTLENVGNNNRNKSAASVGLHGVQVVAIDNNTFTQSAPVKVVQTVGGPITGIRNNQFHRTEAPEIVNGDAELLGNTYDVPQPAAVGGAENVRVAAATGAHPRLLVSVNDIALMASQGQDSPTFAASMARSTAFVDPYLERFPDVPVPADAGGGYTHEQHKRNQRIIHDAGMLFQLTGNRAYANLARDILLKYADMYPGLGEHPMKKEQSPGRLFWQSLNEAVWLVYVIQGYDLIHDALAADERKAIEDNLFHPMVKFLADDSPQTFDRIHNHGTWAAAAVGMTGYALGERDYVEKALLGLDKRGNAGFLKQLDMLFSPDGLYGEGPYYQRYALMPFILFAKAIQTNEPERNIFEYRDGLLFKAVNSAIQLSYGGRFFPYNDALKDKGLDTIELYYGIAIAYGMTRDPALLSIAAQHQGVVLSGDGLQLAQALDSGLAKPFAFTTRLLRDGADGTHGAVSILRHGTGPGHAALVFKATAQGQGHGHFDRLGWMYYDNGHEIISDYGAARFLNVEEKNGGHYLRENDSWAKQSIAHNTLVVDETSHFGGDWKRGEQFHPEVLYFDTRPQVSISAARSDHAYDGVSFSRIMLLLDSKQFARPLVVDLLKVRSSGLHQYDLPLHYHGHLTYLSHPYSANTQTLPVLGEKNGYQHLWLKAQAGLRGNDLFKATWIKANRFYTWNTLSDSPAQVLFTELGANDPDFNLRTETALVLRVPAAKDQTFVSVLEAHGEYDGAREFTTRSASDIESLERTSTSDADLITITRRGGAQLRIVLAGNPDPEAAHEFQLGDQALKWNGPYQVFENGETGK